MMEETIYNVHWEGPFNWEDKIQNNKEFVLYSLHGTHPLYGNNVLLYIGMTETSPGKRFIGHSNWVKSEYDDIKIKLASVGKFNNWEEWDKYPNDRWKKFNNNTILKNIESLLIFAQQPVYNQVNKETANNAEGIRIFNTGKIGLLMPEISYWYHIGKK